MSRQGKECLHYDESPVVILVHVERTRVVRYVVRVPEENKADSSQYHKEYPNRSYPENGKHDYLEPRFYKKKRNDEKVDKEKGVPKLNSYWERERDDKSDERGVEMSKCVEGRGGVSDKHSPLFRVRCQEESMIPINVKESMYWFSGGRESSSPFLAWFFCA